MLCIVPYILYISFVYYIFFDRQFHFLLQILKLYAWEIIFKDKIIAKRKTELRKLLNLKILERILETTFHIAPFIVSKSILLTPFMNNNRLLIFLLYRFIGNKFARFFKFLK